MSWDWLVSGGVIIALVIIVICKVTKQTFPELMAGIKELIKGKSEDYVPVYEMPY